MRKSCLQSLCMLARQDPRVVFIGSDITKRDLEDFASEFPERFFLDGIYEQHIVGMAAGMALAGKCVYVNTIAAFLTGRSFEQCRIDLGLHRANVRLLGSGGGTVYAPLGPTHLATDDMAIMRAIPNMTVVAPCDAEEMRKLMRASLAWEGPIYIRIAKGGDPMVTQPDTPFAIGKPILLRDGGDVLMVTTGILTQVALNAAAELQASGIAAAVLHVHTVKPLDIPALLAHAAGKRAVIVAEEHSVIGGLSSAVGEAFLDAAAVPPRFARLGLPDAFINTHGSQQQILARYNLTPAGLTATAHRLLQYP